MRLLRVVVNLLRLPLLPFFWLLRGLTRPKAPVLRIKLRSRLAEISRPLPWFARYFPSIGRALPTSLEQLRHVVDLVARDAMVRAVWIDLPPLVAGWADAEGLRDVIAALRAKGKRVLVRLPHGGGHKEMLVAAAADRIVLAPHATLAMVGLSAEKRYFRSALQKLGVEVDVFARGEFKSAADAFARDEMSGPEHEQTQALLAALQHALDDALRNGRRLSEEQVAAIFERALFHGKAAVAVGLVDAVAYEDEIVPLLAEMLGAKAASVRVMRAPRYVAYHDATWFSPVFRKPYVAVIPVHGPISQSGAASQRGAAAEAIVASLRAARADKLAVGVILHIDSPGGSAIASDEIHREVVRLKERKPVIACFGNVAASGGYYVAAPADLIVARPTTVTGSIGVISARLVAREALGKLGVRTQVVKTAPHADMFSIARTMTDDERAAVDRETGAFYDAFVGIVAEGRKRPFEQVEPLARGRVWTGIDALGHGLVDVLGGLETALDAVHERVGIPKPLRTRIPMRLVVPTAIELPPAEPISAWLSSFAPEVRDVGQLLSGPDRVLAYAPWLPTIR